MAVVRGGIFVMPVPGSASERWQVAQRIGRFWIVTVSYNPFV